MSMGASVWTSTAFFGEAFVGRISRVFVGYEMFVWTKRVCVDHEALKEFGKFKIEFFKIPSIICNLH